MKKSQSPLPDIEYLIENDPDVLAEKNANGRALVLLQKFHFDLCTIMKKTGASKSGIYRAKNARSAGYDITKSGRHRKLCERDEEIIVHWALELINMGETLHTSTLIDLVCIICPFRIHYFNYLSRQKEDCQNVLVDPKLTKWCTGDGSTVF